VSFLVRGGSISSVSGSIIITPEEESEGIESLSSSPSIVTAKSTLEVKKRNGSIEPLKKEKIKKEFGPIHKWARFTLHSNIHLVR
jgi:hypothetical protein